MFQYCLFDLDGTLTDPREGITKSVQYALRFFGIEEPDLKKLEVFIGPPLKDSFMEFYGLTEEKAVEAVARYRERFAPTGVLENYIFPGIPDMLFGLKEKGVRLAVASSKPTVFVRKILAHFDIEKYFDVVVGSELDGRRSSKEEVVEETLRQLNILTIEVDKRRECCAMIGDRKFDIQGAKAHALTPVGVGFGFASPGELEAAGAAYIAQTVEELGRYLGAEKAAGKAPE